MDFQWPSVLWLLLLLPALILTYLLTQWRRQRYALQFAERALVKDALRGTAGFRRHVPPLLFLLAATAIIISVARPVAVIRAPSEEGTVILAIDLSASMTAVDLKPSRLEAAKAAANAFISRQPATVKFGIVSFSDGAFVAQSPTNDRDAVLTAIDHLYPQRGTAIGRGLLTSLEAIFEASDSIMVAAGPSSLRVTPTPTPTPVPQGVFLPAVIILLTDGENTVGPDPRAAARLAAARGVRVFTIGLGTREGAVVRVQGQSIHSRLDEPLLKDIAQIANGAYYNVTNEGQLAQTFTNIGTHVVLRTVRTEVTALWSGAAAVLIVFGGVLSLLWFNRMP